MHSGTQVWPNAIKYGEQLFENQEQVCGLAISQNGVKSHILDRD